MAARGLNVFVNIGAKVAGSVGASASAVERRFSQMGRALKIASAETSAAMIATEKRWGKFHHNATNFAFAVSAPIGLMAGMGADAAYQFAKIGNELQGVTEMSDDARKSIEKLARSLPGKSTDNLAAALDLGRTGFETNAIKGSLPTAIRLGQAERGMTTERASDIASNVMTGMGMLQKGDSAEAVAKKFTYAADRIAFGAAKSSSNIDLMGDSFKYAGPLGSRLGMGMDELTAIFMTMADAGIKGSEAGVAFRSMLVRMVKPTKSGAATLARLGLELKDFVAVGRKASGDDIVSSLMTKGIDASGQKGAINKLIASDLGGPELTQKITDLIVGSGSAVDRETIADSLQEALLSGVNKVDAIKLIEAMKAKGATMADLLNFVDTRQGARLSTLFGPELVKNLGEMSKADGFLMRQWQMQQKGIVGAVARFQQAKDNLFIAIGESGVMDLAANAMTKFANAIMKLSEVSPGTLKALTGLVLGMAVLGPIGMVMGGLASGVRLVGGSLMFLGKTVGPMLARLINLRGIMLALRIAAFAGLGSIAAITWPVVAAIAGLGLALAFIISKWNGIKAFFSGFAEGFVKAAGPEAMGALKAFGDGIMAVFGAIFWPIKKVWGALKAVFGWVAQLFAPAEADKWRAWGEIAGAAVGGLVSKITWLVDKLSAAKNGITNLFSAGAGSVPGVGAFDAMGNPTGARAGGGSVMRGGVYKVNERGQELFAPGRSGTIINARATAALLAAANSNTPASGGGGGVSVGNINIYGANDPQSTRRVVREELRKLASAQRGVLGD